MKENDTSILEDIDDLGNALEELLNSLGGYDNGRKHKRNTSSNTGRTESAEGTV